MKIGALVITHNRLELLKQCLDAIESQTRRPDFVLIVDNASSDGTRLEVEKRMSDRVQALFCGTNLGSAGGFEQGFIKLSELGADSVWTMDDDVIPTPSALDELIRAAEANPGFSFLCSNVVSKNGAMMNIPHVNLGGGPSGEPAWNKHLASGCVEIAAGTWVSALFPRMIWKRIGFPMGRLFIWGDDIEYTRRCFSCAPGLLVGKSVVTHMRASGKSIDISNETDPKRLGNYFYYYRNITFIRRRYDGGSKLMLSIARSISVSVLCLLKHRSPLRAAIVIRGLVAGLLFRTSVRNGDRSGVNP